MAGDKWIAPPCLPLLAPLTITGPNGSGQLFTPYASPAAIDIGTVMRVRAHGVITTTGTPTLTVTLGALLDTYSIAAAAPTNAAGQTWTIEFSETLQSIGPFGWNVARYVKIAGLTGTAVEASSVITFATPPTSPTIDCTIFWSSGADAGDIVTMHNAYAEWSG